MIYISGPMTGKLNYNYPEFNRVTNELRSTGLKVINPVEICAHLDNTKATWEDYMDVCIPAIKDCRTILLLDDWHKSRGAKIELKTAIELGLEVRIYEPI